MFSKLKLFVALMLAISASARPAEKRWGPGGPPSFGGRDNHEWWAPSRTSSYLDFGKRTAFDNLGTCDLNNALGAMNLAKVSPALPQPAAGLKLFQVVIGRGTQNYTCDQANATATPVAAGAVATLWNVSCIAADMPALLEKLPAIALDLPMPTSDDPNSPINQDMSGHHYFIDATTPFFNMDTVNHQYGMGALAKANASDAPSGAYLGPYGQGDGAVQWLKLDSVSSTETRASTEDKWKQVYRLNTAGGVPPKTCKEVTGLPDSFTVEYAAEYWLFT